MKGGIDPDADDESRYNQAQQRPDHAQHNAPGRDSNSLQLATTSSDAPTGSPAKDDTRNAYGQKRRKDQSTKGN